MGGSGLVAGHGLPPATRAQPSCLFHDPDGTIASVRNELANTAKGEWLLFLDADDELAPGYLDAMTRALGQERAYLTAYLSCSRPPSPMCAKECPRGRSFGRGTRPRSRPATGW